MGALEVFSELLAPGGALMLALGKFGHAWQKREREHREELERRDAFWSEKLDQRDAELKQAYKDLAIGAAYVRYVQRHSRPPVRSTTDALTTASTLIRSVETPKRLPPPPLLPQTRTPSWPPK